jgi:hypothetical protein
MKLRNSFPSLWTAARNPHGWGVEELRQAVLAAESASNAAEQRAPTPGDATNALDAVLQRMHWNGNEP